MVQSSQCSSHSPFNGTYKILWALVCYYEPYYGQMSVVTPAHTLICSQRAWIVDKCLIFFVSLPETVYTGPLILLKKERCVPPMQAEPFPTGSQMPFAERDVLLLRQVYIVSRGFASVEPSSQERIRYVTSDLEVLLSLARDGSNEHTSGLAAGLLQERSVCSC